MRKVFSSLVLSWMATLVCLAQTDLTLNIQHLLDGESFAFEKTVQNNVGHNFQLDRLQYYLGNISFIHDGGIETKVEEKWILVNAAQEVNEALGQFDIESLEKIVFHIGVEEAYNHLDPATYDQDHPLAPKWPSMHWGWTSGYRFLALEGISGEAVNQPMEIHALGNDNYFSVEMNYPKMAEAGELQLYLEADYLEALRDMSLNSGIFVHGEDRIPRQALENFRDHVFSVGEVLSNTEEAALSSAVHFDIFPNPSINRQINYELSGLENADELRVEIMDVTGKLVARKKVTGKKGSMSLSDLGTGVYYLRIFNKGSVRATSKLKLL